jgi:quercetin dioxygenase-like cupin family protein
MRTFSTIVVLCSVVACLGACGGKAPSAPANLHYQRIVLSPLAVEQPLLEGPPQTAGMRSGRVVLQQGKTMSRHSTRSSEEFLIFLKGSARVQLGDDTLIVNAGEALYIPPQTYHELHNDNAEECRYIYVVAPAHH